MDTGHYQGRYPMQCDDCGRELINMGCVRCSPYKQPATRLETRLAKRLEEVNCGGFPKFGQLSPSTSVPTWSDGPPSPRKRVNGYRPPKFFRYLPFQDFHGKKMKLMEGKPHMGLGGRNGHHRPFSQRVKEGETFTAVTEFKWGSHKWETREVHYHRDTTEAAIFKSLCIYFLKFLKEHVRNEECSNSRVCLCGGSNSLITEEDIVIPYCQIIDMNESFKVIVYADAAV